MFRYECQICHAYQELTEPWLNSVDRIQRNLPVHLDCQTPGCDGALVYTVNKFHVDLIEIATQRKLGWPDFDPEDYCHRCGNRNCVWWTDSDRFNLALGSHGVDPEWQGILCPPCFIELHEEKTNLKASWRLIPDTFKGL